MKSWVFKHFKRLINSKDKRVTIAKIKNYTQFNVGYCVSTSRWSVWSASTKLLFPVPLFPMNTESGPSLS